MGHHRLDQARLRTDPEYLAAKACEKFKENDRYHNGLLTAKAFSQALDDLGLRYGQKEVEEIMQYCVVTDDGYVHYKDLIYHCAPEMPRAKQSSMKATIWPEEDQGSSYSSRRGDTPSSTTASSRNRLLSERS